MKVWMLTNGTYSDYGVVAIYGSREVAERALALIQGPDGTHGDDPGIWEMDVHDDVDLGQQVDYGVPVERRSGEPTVVRMWSPRGYREAEHVREVVVGLGSNWKAKRRVWMYSGTDAAAVHACARAQSQAIHGTVVTSEDVADWRRLIR